MSAAEVTNKEDVACIACGNSRWAAAPSASTVDYSRCLNCNFHVQQLCGHHKHAKFEIEQQKNYSEGAPLTTEVFDYLGKQRIGTRVRLLRKLKVQGRAIEVGPGNGRMLEVAAQFGFDIDAVEHSPALASQLASKLGIKVFTGEFETLPLEHSAYDLFLSFHVIEHVPDVVAHLQKAAQIVKPGGFAIIATPNADSWEHRVPFGASPNYSTAHLQLFSKRSMSLLLANTGWNLQEVHTPSYAEYWVRVLSSLVRTFRARNNQQPAQRGVLRDVSPGRTWVAISALRALSFITFPMRWLQARLGFGNELLVLAQRSA